MVGIRRIFPETLTCCARFEDYIEGPTKSHFNPPTKVLFNGPEHLWVECYNTGHLIENAPQELKVAAACLCAGLMPPSIFADLLEDHRPDLSEAAAFLREWERLKGEQK